MCLIIPCSSHKDVLHGSAASGRYGSVNHHMPFLVDSVTYFSTSVMAAVKTSHTIQVTHVYLVITTAHTGFLAMLVSDSSSYWLNLSVCSFLTIFYFPYTFLYSFRRFSNIIFYLNLMFK